jgi:hypothetical protein
MGIALFLKLATNYLAASGAAGAAFSTAFLCDLCDLCMCLCFIGAAVEAAGAAAVGAAVSSAAIAPMLNVAAKTPANNADNNLFILNFL